MSRFAALLLLAISALTACDSNVTVPTGTNTGTGTAVPFAKIQSIVSQRCNGCHSTTPSYTGFSAPADRLDLTLPQTIKSTASRIYRVTVSGRSMPERNNITGMTDEERSLLGQWVEQGANLQ